ncbi:uncharacterized protein RSE6_13466 [Rhynchosporium secalis]|uniref:LPXTG-domain-containing protein n=1 Tax=Rhynchosporium secalis TaxID=38038 RepID=A0A1E1MSX8_RHYSE|nr:uncharacterized protein RSE6_13466 [Rhynchosporium secalis]
MVFRNPRGENFSAIPTRRASKATISTLAIAVVLLNPASALQVTPYSACAPMCMDTPLSDASDPNASNTFDSDIVCKDSDFSGTLVGSKFQSCLNCLQGSSATSFNENDQGWFFYNLRFAFNSCVFGTSNATRPISTPCSTEAVCGPIRKAMGDGMGTPLTTGQYSYCEAYDNSFLGSMHTCRSCLKLEDDASYLSNFLVALRAGCTERPTSGLVVGLNSTLFTKDEVAITYPQGSKPRKKHKNLSTGAIIGIAVGCGLLLLATLAIVFVCLMKRRNANRLKLLQSPLHERYGAENITAPNSGAYSSPQTSPPLKKESVQMMTTLVRNFSYTRQQPQSVRDWQGNSTGKSPAYPISPPSYSPPFPNSGRDVLPAHHAYIPPEYTPPSRNSTSPLYVQQQPPSGPPSQLSPQQVPRPVPASHPQWSPSQRLSSAPNAPAVSQPPAVRRDSHSSDNLSSHPTPPPVVRNISSASRLQSTNLGARRGLAPTTVVTGMKPTGTEDSTKAKENLCRQGLGGTRAHGPEAEIPERPSPESDVGSVELWPGSY